MRLAHHVHGHEVTSGVELHERDEEVDLVVAISLHPEVHLGVAGELHILLCR